MRSGNNFAIYHSKAPCYLGAAGWRAAAFYFLLKKLHYVYFPNGNNTVVNRVNFIYALNYNVASTPSISTKLAVSQQNYCGDFFFITNVHYVGQYMW